MPTDPTGIIDLPQLLSADRILYCGEQTKSAVLARLIETLAATDQITDPEEFRLAVYRREELMSTGIGLGIALPHVRLASVTRMVMAVAICAPPINDYESLDGRPVDLVIMIAGREHQHAQYLKTLASVSGMLKDTSFRTALLKTETPAAAYKLFTGNRS